MNTIIKLPGSLSGIRSGSPEIKSGISNNGLVLYLDAGDRNSYPRTGNTWFDLSISKTNGTLVPSNASRFNSDNGGSITFNKIDQYVDFGTILRYETNPATFTFSYWAYYPDFTTNSGVQGPIMFFTGGCTLSGYYDQLTTGGGDPPYSGIVFVTSSVAGACVGTYTDSLAVKKATWVNICHVVNGSSARIYVNGVDRSRSMGVHATPIKPSVNAFRLGHYLNGGYFMNGRISVFMNYNRPLMPYEVKNNYDALKGRFP